MNLSDRILEIPLVIVLIVGGYQFYFWAQRQTFFPARYIETRADSWFSFDPRWVWVYSGLYYPMIVLAALSIPTWSEFSWVVGNFLALLAIQVSFFIFLPVAIPATWRTNDTVERAKRAHPRSAKFLDLVWSYDKLRNSMPSMHVSVATMVDLTIHTSWPMVGIVGVCFPVLIAASAIKTKQHYVLDVVPGAVLGSVVFFGYRWAFM